MLLIRITVLLSICALLACSEPEPQAGRLTANPPAEQHFGAIDDILFWTPEQKIAGFRHIDKLTWTRKVEAGGTDYPLPYVLLDLSDLTFEYDGRVMSIDDYVEQNNVAGLLLIKDGNIAYERYELGHTETSLWLSWSVAKSVTSLLVGAAIQDGYIDNVDEMITDYLPRLKNSSYDQATIRDVLQMSSGVEWNEDYADPLSDINTMAWDTLSVYEYLRHKPRNASPGEQFNYNTAETNLVGTMLRSAIGNNLSTYLSAKIWRPYGMEFDANWQLSEPEGGEFGGSSISATLRDYGRIGLFALHGGQLPDGTAVLPECWIEESTSPSAGYSRYGYLWWLGADGVFAASGIFGQAIDIDPQRNLVIVMHSAREHASRPEDWAVQKAFFSALKDAATGN